MGNMTGHTSKTEMPGWVQGPSKGLMKDYLTQASPGGHLPQWTETMKQSQADFTPDQTAAMQQIRDTAPGLQEKSTALLGDTISGKYLDPSTNPYLQQTFDQASQAVTDKYRTAIAPSTMAAAMNAGGGMGTAYNQQAMQNQYGLGQTLNNLGTDIFGGNYQQALGRQMQAEQMLPQVYSPTNTLLGVGGIQQEQAQQNLNLGSQNELARVQFPAQMAQQTSQTIQGIRGGEQETTAPDKLWGLK